jgi:hypothetical protein
VQSLTVPNFLSSRPTECSYPLGGHGTVGESPISPPLHVHVEELQIVAWTSLCRLLTFTPAPIDSYSILRKGACTS